MAMVYITAGIISFFAAAIGVLVAFKIQTRILHKTGLEHEAWQHAQEAHQELWEAKQRKQALELEQSLIKQMEELHETWQRWELKAAQQNAKLTLEQKLASLPYIEDIPVPSQRYTTMEHITPSSNQLSHPISFFRTDLRGQDFSRRFLQHADFRETNLEHANFYMTDLTGASFKGANLTGANLAGANLNGADLRDALLTDANMLVTDLNGAILNGAHLFGTRNLTIEQFNSAISNHETQIDLEQDITHPRIARVHISESTSSPENIHVEIDSPQQTSMYNGKAHLKSH